MADESVAELSQTYLGNILYALERCAMALTDEGKSRGAKAVGWGALAAAFVLAAIVARYVAEGAA